MFYLIKLTHTTVTLCRCFALSMSYTFLVILIMVTAPEKVSKVKICIACSVEKKKKNFTQCFCYSSQTGAAKEKPRISFQFHNMEACREVHQFADIKNATISRSPKGAVYISTDMLNRKVAKSFKKVKSSLTTSTRNKRSWSDGSKWVG